MARKYGKVNKVVADMTQYDYILNGTGGIGKTDLAVKVGKIITGSDEGTFVITLGLEPKPTHINGAFYAYAEDWEMLDEIVDDLVENRQDYSNTVWIAMDSLDELFRLAEQETIRVWNKDNPNDKVKSISQAFKGFQKGENYALKLVLELRQRLRLAGYKFFDLGHTKEKSKMDLIQNIEFKQYTNKLDAKYYDAIKDKSAIACVAYDENEIADIKEVTDAFTKGKKKVGNLISRKRVICFRDDDYSCDCKSYFKYIVPKIDFSPENFIEAIKNAIKAEVEAEQNKDNKIGEVGIKEIHKEVETKQEQPKKKKELPSPKELIKQLQPIVMSDEEKANIAVSKLKEFGEKDFSSLTSEQLVQILEVVQ